MRCSDALPPFPPHFVAFAWRYHPYVCVRFSTRTRRRSAGQGFFRPTTPTSLVSGWRRPGLPGSWRTLVYVPCSRTPTGPPRQAACDASVLPSAFGTASAPAITLLTGLNHTARTLAVYASQCRLPEHHARLATGWAANPSRTGLSPAGLQRKVSAHASPFPRLILAQAKRTQKVLY